ncbi:hypothetical protein QCD79_30635, partial [Pseudomonas quasicaspiana]|nr:hypothetical protein [Pseudomonas quasicaspiana]
PGFFVPANAKTLGLAEILLERGLPAKNDDALDLTYRVDCFASKLCSHKIDMSAIFLTEDI